MKFKPKNKGPEYRPGVEIGDHIYFQCTDGPRSGRVRARGKHGCTIECDGQFHKVTWEKVLGHKKRARQRFTILDEGEDGVIVQDAAGQRRYLSIPPQSEDDPLMTKAFDVDGRLVLFTKASGSGVPFAGRPGLTRKQIVDRTGRKQTKWVRTQKDQPQMKPRAKGDDGLPEAGSAAGYGTHDLQAGDKVEFRAGDFSGTGVIVGKPGADGAHVKDSRGRIHQVRWSEITGHDKGDAQKPDAGYDVRASQKPIPADQFVASDYAKQHDDPNVTPESIIAQFPSDTESKIKQVQERLKSIEQTIDKYRQEDGYVEERKKLHEDIFKHFFRPDRVAAARPADGEKPTFTMLGGRGGSGTSWFKGKVYDPAKCIVLDADEIKGMLPEYEGWNAHQVHEESSEILESMLKYARMKGLNVVLDATMKTAKGALEKIRDFKGAGYRIEAHYMHLPRQEAAKRAVARFLGKTQRYVPVSVVLANTTNEATFDEVRKHADRWSFFDNNVEQGRDPIKISEGGGKELLKKSLAGVILIMRRTRK